MATEAAGPAAEGARRTAGRACRAGRKLIVRVDRVELSKNILRGIWAMDELLEQFPRTGEERAVMLALAYPSREGLADYLPTDPRSSTQLSGSTRVLGNSRLDARYCSMWPMTGPRRSPRSDSNTTCCWSTRFAMASTSWPRKARWSTPATGSWCSRRKPEPSTSWHDAALGVNPFDITATATALLDRGLSMPAEERAVRAATLRATVLGRPAADWLTDQLAVVAGLPT